MRILKCNKMIKSRQNSAVGTVPWTSLNGNENRTKSAKRKQNVQTDARFVFVLFCVVLCVVALNDAFMLNVCTHFCCALFGWILRFLCLSHSSHCAFLFFFSLQTPSCLCIVRFEKLKPSNWLISRIPITSPSIWIVLFCDVPHFTFIRYVFFFLFFSSLCIRTSNRLLNDVSGACVLID